MSRLMRSTILSLLLVSIAAPSFAGLGFHAGLSLDPDDFLFGVRFKSHPIEEHVSIVPSVEVGFGDATMVAGNVDLHWAIMTDSNYNPYVGGGLTLNWFDFDGGSTTELGGSILGGLDINEKFFFEAKIGLGDVPDVKLVVGWRR
jgi:hypothetical protein